MSDGSAIGVITVTRVETGPFADHHVQLLQTFADQAVIAIENARLFEQVQAKTRDLTESLEQQTATSEVLEVISASPGELEPVFQKMLENATRVCGAQFGVMSLWDGTISISPRATTFRPRLRPPGKTRRSHPLGLWPKSSKLAGSFTYTTCEAARDISPVRRTLWRWPNLPVPGHS